MAVTASIPTGLFVLYPHRYLDPVDPVDPIELGERWEYDPDPYFGVWDVVQPAAHTVETASGDCDDYARMAASHLYHNTDRPVALYVMFRKHNPPGHLVAYDGERVWTTGETLETDIVEYSAGRDQIIVGRRGIRDAGSLPRLLWRPGQSA